MPSRNHSVLIRRFEFGGEVFTARLYTRPFREGGEVRISLSGGEEIHIAELGLGSDALLHKIEAELSRRSSSSTQQKAPPRFIDLEWQPLTDE